MTKNENPYLKKPKTPDIVHYCELHDFTTNASIEKELLPGEMCFARIPNTSPLGMTHHVAMVFKDRASGDIFSIPAIQHHGVLKDTKENRDALDEQEPTKEQVVPKDFGSRVKKESKYPLRSALEKEA